jgi:hypothetical protein
MKRIERFIAGFGLIYFVFFIGFHKLHRFTKFSSRSTGRASGNVLFSVRLYAVHQQPITERDSVSQSELWRRDCSQTAGIYMITCKVWQ